MELSFPFFHPSSHPCFQAKPLHRGLYSNPLLFLKTSQLARAHTNLQTERLAQESLASLHGAILLHLELEESEDSGGHDEQLHLGNVAADTGTGTVAEGDEGGLLAGGQALGAPALGNELLGVGTPDFLGAVDGVAGNGKDIAGLEGVAADHDGGCAGRNLAGKTHGGGAVDTHGFPDDPLEAAKIVSLWFLFWLCISAEVVGLTRGFP